MSLESSLEPLRVWRSKEEQRELIESCRALLLKFHPEAIKEMVPTDELLENWPPASGLWVPTIHDVIKNPHPAPNYVDNEIRPPEIPLPSGN